MVAHKVDDSQMILALAQTQTAPKLLQEHHWGFGGPQHEHRVNLGYIDTLVEHVDGKHHLQFPRPQISERISAVT